MEFSRFNIISGIEDSEKCFVMNPLYGNADIIDRETLKRLQCRDSDSKEFCGRGYLVDPDAEKSEFRKAYMQFIEERDTDEIQLFFIPGYNCNFNCSYCYQENYRDLTGWLNPAVVDAFFQYVDSVFGKRRKYITLFGGEPLLPGRSYKACIKKIAQMATRRSIDLAVVTNGYHIDEYIEIFRNSTIREVQVTLDGTREVHDKRRHLKSGQGTFDKIVSGIDLLLGFNIPVNLRVVIDRDNISDLQNLARFAIDRGWTESSLFKTQLGRNYELHDCRRAGGIFSRIEMYRELYGLIKEHPHILEFHKPSFSVARYLAENGEMPAPLFDACPGTKTEWAFDYTGKIYACTATVGKTGEELGRFFPERVLNEDRIQEWSQRDILSIKECRACNLSLLCGGGCAAIAKNRTGSLNQPDCRPVAGLLELGIAAYFQDKL
jgi:uncharacterized protein